MASVGEFHRTLKPRSAEAFLSLRALAVSLGPDVVERVGSDRVTYLRRDQPFLIVHPSKSRLQVGFPADITIADPSGRLLRRGEEKYVTIDGPEGVDGHVQEFVRRAYTTLRH